MDLRNKIARHVEAIDEIISNDDEKAKVMAEIQDLIQEFTKQVVVLSERQDEFDGAITDLYEQIVDIQGFIHDDGLDDFMDKCPYCGMEFPVIVGDDSNEVVCPHCGKTIDVNYLDDDDE